MAAVVTGGVISGGATLGTAVARERIVARREHGALAAEVRGIARYVAIDFRRAATLVGTAHRNEKWWPSQIQVPRGGGENDRRVLGTHLSRRQWAVAHNAWVALVVLEALGEVHGDDRSAVPSENTLKGMAQMERTLGAAAAMLERFADE